MYLETENKEKFIFHQSEKKMGIVLCVFLTIINIYFYIKNGQFSNNSLIILLIFILLTFIYPKVFKPINKIFSFIILFLAEYISKVLMLILYFLVLFPLSLISKISLFKSSKDVFSTWEKYKEENNDFNNQF